MTKQTGFKSQASLISAFPFVVEHVASSIDGCRSHLLRQIIWRSFALDGGPISTKACLAAASGMSQAGVDKIRQQVLESIRAELLEGTTCLSQRAFKQVMEIKNDLRRQGKIISGSAFRGLLQRRCGEPVHPRWFRLLATILGYLPVQGALAARLKLRDLWVSEKLIQEKAIDTMLKRLDVIQGTLREAYFSSLLMELRQQTGADLTARDLTNLLETIPALEIHHGVVRTVSGYLLNPRDRGLRQRDDAKPRTGHECTSPMKDRATGKTMLINHGRGETPEQAVARRKAMHPSQRGRVLVRSLPGVHKLSGLQARAAANTGFR